MPAVPATMYKKTFTDIKCKENSCAFFAKRWFRLGFGRVVSIEKYIVPVSDLISDIPTMHSGRYKKSKLNLFLNFSSVIFVPIHILIFTLNNQSEL